MDWLDIITFMEITKNVKGTETNNFCNSTPVLRNLCEKYSHTIWSSKLYEDFNITEEQIIGDPKSYYMGIENNVFQWYFYEIEKDGNNIIDKNVIQTTKEDAEYDDHFKIPGIKSLTGITVVIGIFTMSHPRYGSETLTVYSNTLEDTKNKLLNMKEKYYPSNEYKDIKDEILKMDNNTVLNEHIDIKGEYIQGVYFPVDVEINIFDITLP